MCFLPPQLRVHGVLQTVSWVTGMHKGLAALIIQSNCYRPALETPPLGHP